MPRRELRGSEPPALLLDYLININRILGRCVGLGRVCAHAVMSAWGRGGRVVCARIRVQNTCVLVRSFRAPSEGLFNSRVCQMRSGTKTDELHQDEGQQGLHRVGVPERSMPDGSEDRIFLPPSLCVPPLRQPINQELSPFIRFGRLAGSLEHV